MDISYEGIGQWAATFCCDENVKVGSLVKVTANHTVSICSDGDGFCGVIASVSHKKDACSVVLGGLVTVAYSGPKPVLGESGLSADGAGGVKSDGIGNYYKIVEVTDRTVTFVL